MKAYQKTAVRGVVREIDIEAQPVDIKKLSKERAFIAGYQQCTFENSELRGNRWCLNGRPLDEILDRGPVLRDVPRPIVVPPSLKMDWRGYVHQARQCFHKIVAVKI